ncbi:hypothetical protein Patl1_34562 [Pistacia atlantica]|uniref:Uncharacterized protein n=1 Tax=Pistacia atlantica TaxID=434234 RepID=A0ACC0ZTW0_9ROSI|nr:hypothetical protein Patl1_34562 [Pistacia atlantica]
MLISTLKSPKKLTILIRDMQCRWSASRLEFAIDVILNVALENKKKFGNGGSSGMS